jgi:acetyl/propionyl-CoA carboxylase alpha subunit
MGHAIEARLYAEDPEAGFLPATGRLALLRWPAGVRVDAGVGEGDEVTDRYDPMLAKLIAHGANRDEALARLRSALAATTVLGVRTNLRFLRWLAGGVALRDGEMRTDTIAALALPSPPRPGDAHWHAAASALPATGSSDPWLGGWRLNAAPVRRLRQGTDERRIGPTRPAAGEGPMAARDGGSVHVDVEGQSVEFTLAQPPTIEDAVRHAAAAGGAGASVLTAPMPGRVIALRAAEGASVSVHQPLIVIEAMKMEHAVTAPSDGFLVRLTVREGQQVQRGDVLGEVVPAG